MKCNVSRFAFTFPYNLKCINEKGILATTITWLCNIKILYACTIRRSGNQKKKNVKCPTKNLHYIINYIITYYIKLTLYYIHDPYISRNLVVCFLIVNFRCKYIRILKNNNILYRTPNPRLYTMFPKSWYNRTVDNSTSKNKLKIIRIVRNIGEKNYYVYNKKKSRRNDNETKNNL